MRISHKIKRVAHAIPIVAPDRHNILHEIGSMSHNAKTVSVAPVRIIIAEIIPINVFICICLFLGCLYNKDSETILYSYND